MTAPAGQRAAVSWAETAWGRSVATVRPLSGGWTSDILRLTADTGDQAVLRLMTREPWRGHAPAMLARESSVQDQLDAGPVPAPRSIAVDLDGSRAGAPAHLMTWLPGRVELEGCSEGLLGRLARLLRDIHRHDPGERPPRDYQSWAHPAKRVVPEWSLRPGLWERAFRVLEGAPPPYRGVFLHRDFHLGNVLWRRGEPSGVVDWVETSWGPAALDVAHCATYLAMLHGLDVAHRFVRAYHCLDPDRGDPRDDRYWATMDIVGYLPGPAKIVQPWRDLGRHVDEVEAQRRLEELLAVTLDL